MTGAGTGVARVLAWAGCTNVRDLGGLPLEDGGTTTTGAVVRADDLGRLTAEGREALEAFGVRRVVDLRWSEERAESPPTTARPEGVEVVHVPVLGANRPETRHERFARLAAEVADEAAFARALYGAYLEEFPEAFAEAVAAVATAPGAVVVHCTAGKDRTGLVAALALRLAGVGVDAVAEDYALTDATAMPRRGLADGMSEEQRRAQTFLFAAPRRGMAQLLEDLDARHGSAADYLEQAGLDPAAAAALRARLRG